MEKHPSEKAEKSPIECLNQRHISVVCDDLGILTKTKYGQQYCD